MTMRSTPLILPLFSVLVLLSFLLPVSASNTSQINVTDIPVRLGQSLNVDTFAGGIICSTILLMICLLPITIITRSKKASWIPEFAISLGIMGSCVAIQWLPVWFLLVLSLLTSLMLSSRFRTWLGG